jgi:type VI secretion system FHA domain protein
MILTLEVVGEQAEDLGAGSRKVFNAIGGTIGRLPDNDWVFPDPYVSGRHALIRYLNGKYFIEDTSTNGVFVNSPENRLSRTQGHQLRNGDLIFIDAYEIKVSIAKDPEASEDDDPFAQLRARMQGGGQRRAAPAAPPTTEEERTVRLVARRKQNEAEVSDESGDHGTQWFGMNDEVAQKPAAAEPAGRGGRGKVEAPRPGEHAGRSARRVPTPPARPAGRAAAQPASTPRGEDAQLAALLEAAGIEGLDPSSKTAETLGEVLRIAVGGVMEVLRARERMKDELRMRGTTFKAAHNNPLKFSANVDDAFHNLLVKQNPAYLDPADAFDDAFQDVRDHQTAFLAAMRIAFESMFAQFDPNRLQEEFDRQMKKGSILGVPAKLKYWDLYRDKYGDLVKDSQTAFRSLFGDAFAKAYEEQLERLRALGRSRDK